MLGGPALLHCVQLPWGRLQLRLGIGRGHLHQGLGGSPYCCYCYCCCCCCCWEFAGDTYTKALEVFLVVLGVVVAFILFVLWELLLLIFVLGLCFTKAFEVILATLDFFGNF